MQDWTVHLLWRLQHWAHQHELLLSSGAQTRHVAKAHISLWDSRLRFEVHHTEQLGKWIRSVHQVLTEFRAHSLCSIGVLSLLLVGRSYIS